MKSLRRPPSYDYDDRGWSHRSAVRQPKARRCRSQSMVLLSIPAAAFVLQLCQPPRWHAQCVTAIERRIAGGRGDNRIIMSVAPEQKNRNGHDVEMPKARILWVARKLSNYGAAKLPMTGRSAHKCVTNRIRGTSNLSEPLFRIPLVNNDN